MNVDSRKSIAVAIFLSGTLLDVLACIKTESLKPDHPRVAATVDGHDIQTRDVEIRAYAYILDLPPDSDVESEKRRIFRGVRGRLIDEWLEEEAARAIGITVFDSEVDAAYADVCKEGDGGVASVLAEVARQGLTMPIYREILRTQLLEIKLARAVFGRSDEETCERLARSLRARAKVVLFE
jgi:hypothetical protein